MRSHVAALRRIASELEASDEIAEAELSIAEVGQAAQAAYSARRRRDGIFPAKSFGEPEWDALLTLMIAAVSDQHVILSDLYRAAGVGDATGQRIVGRLERTNLVIRQKSGGNVVVKLSPAAIDLLAQFFAKQSAQAEL